MDHNDTENDNMTSNISTNAFAPDWDATDITHLQPEHLTRTKPVRGWERKPASPFTKQRLRVGKVWRRAAPVGRAMASNATAQTEERTIKRLREGQSTQSPLKIVKRLCLGANNGVGLQWDKIESPTKRIVTRSAAASDHVALSDEEDDLGSDHEEEEVEGTIIEILEEDGTTLRLDADQAQDDEEWSDEDASDDLAEQELDETAVGERPTGMSATPPQMMPDLSAPLPRQFVLPAGFVSPVRQKQPFSRQTLSRTNEDSRRRTLPQTFAPIASTEHPEMSAQSSVEASTEIDPTQEEEHEIEMEKEQSEDPQEEQTTSEDSDIVTTHRAGSASNEDEWEDVQEDHENTLTQGAVSPQNTEQRTVSPMARSPSQQLDLPLRRSPRRKSSSPTKQRSFQTFMDPTDHLVAFSPVKSDVLGSCEPKLQNMDSDDIMQDLADGSPVMLERSVSAPPEEPQMSPRRSARPRVSDDTALLQAFLNRAAENKSSRRLSASKRESLSNRRDSDTVRQALASPAKPEILGALDPNSPSPKKSLAVLEDLKVTKVEEPAISSPQQSSGDTENAQVRTTRRSHRDKRRVERAVPLGHTKISLRGNTDPVVLKRSEAQELATMTRANTRKNKLGAIMPTLRLTKLIVERPPIEASPEEEVADTGAASLAQPGVRRVKWDETLAYYQEAPKEPEVQLFELGDSNTAPKLQAPPADIVEENDSDEAMPGPPPAAETPSKPKIRKLRAPRTASNTGKAQPAPSVSKESVVPTPSALKPKQPRRSKLATPGKGLDVPSLLSAATSSVPSVETTATSTRPKAIPRKKAISRLPAPAPVSLSTSSHEVQSLIASPPKKKSTSGVLPTKGPATKLDFQTKLSAPSKPADNASAGPPGLMSPAKRGGRNVMFGTVPAGPVFGAAKPEVSEDRKVLGLSSPAKKRTRRAV
ncbi:hypothetical protein Q7P35_010574 [Cladosporium inversicolor]